MTQLYRPERDVIDAVEGAEWMKTQSYDFVMAHVEREIQYIEDVITATEKAMDDALWDGDYDLAERCKRELEGLVRSQERGEQYVTSW